MSVAVRLYGFPGGLELKSTCPPVGLGAIQPVELPERLFLPLLDYRLQPIECSVQTGQSVLAGQWLAPGLLCPSSGTVTSVEPHRSAHPSQRAVPHLVIDVDGADALAPDLGTPPVDPGVDWLERCALSGLGGAGFSLPEKLRSWRGEALPLLIINAAECEPGIASDESLMREDAAGIIDGILTLASLLRAERCTLAIEDDMPEALAELRQALHSASLRQTTQPPIEIVVLPSRYPAGAEGPLIQQLLGRRPAAGQRPADLGVLCVNVSTAHSVHLACQGRPALGRLVTINGPGATRPGVFRVRYGMRVSDLLRASGNASAGGTGAQTDAGADTHARIVRHGGPLSGYPLSSHDVSTGPSTHCLWIEEAAAPPAPAIQPCIRCGRCAEVCPVQILPQQLYAHACHDDLARSRQFGIDACITCGCCDLVCPSSIPLTAQFRSTRSAVAAQRRERQQAEQAEVHFRAHQQRLQAREAHRIRQLEERKQALRDQSAGQDPVQAALARARQRVARAADADALPGHDHDSS